MNENHFNIPNNNQNVQPNLNHSNPSQNLVSQPVQFNQNVSNFNDYNFIERQVTEYINLKNMSIQEIKYKLMLKGIDKELIEKYIYENKEKLEEYEKKSAENIRVKKAKQMDEEQVKQYLYKKGYRLSE